MGAITPLGHSTQALWNGLIDGQSGIAPITQFDASSFPTRIAGEVKNFDPSDYVNPKEARRIARCSQLALATLQEALADSGLVLTPDNKERTGVLIGTGLGGLDKAKDVNETLNEKGWNRINPFSGLGSLSNMTSHHLSEAIGVTGPSLTIVTACAAGTHAIGEAAEIIRRGAADVMVCGGVEGLIIDFLIGAFSVMRLLSMRNDEPEKASRPFDRDRDGFVLAEGCGLLILENLEHAMQRGASIHAEVLGYASSSSARHIAKPDPEGATRTMRWAIQDAGISTDDIDYVNAHGTSTPKGDQAETVAIKRTFGKRAYSIPVNSTKSMIGHCIGAAGAIEAIVCVQSIKHDIIHPTLNYETPEPACDLDYVPGLAREHPVHITLSNSFGLGGQNACLVLGEL
jgi:beta-ketoacyl-acyl-carrier-protein synthase II